MSNVAGKAYGMTVITPFERKGSALTRLIFRFARSFPATLSGLLGLKFIHFARWAIVPADGWPSMGQAKSRPGHDCLLFISNFNGTWDQYIDAFADGIPTGLDLFWYRNARYPRSVPITPFKNYIRANQIDCDYYYNATPGASYRDIISALKIRRALIELEDCHARTSPEGFATLYRKHLLSIQNDMTTQGFSPLASLDTEAADANRQRYVKLRQVVAKGKITSFEFEGK